MMRRALLVTAFLLAAAPAAAELDAQGRIDVLRSLTAGRGAAALAAPPAPDRTRRLGDRSSRPPRNSCSRHAWWRGSPAALRLRIERSIQDAAALAGVPASLVRSVIRVESNYDPDAVSHAGAQGLMQLMPGTARELGVVCAFDPRENILAGTRYLKRMFVRFGSWADALAAYNAGPGRVARGGRLPEETRHYVRRVLAHYRAGTGGR